MMAKSMLTILGIVALFYAAACAALWLWQDSLVFPRQPASAENNRRLSDKAVSLRTTDGVTLRGWLYESAKPQTGCQLIIHYGGNAEEASEDYLETTHIYRMSRSYLLIIAAMATVKENLPPPLCAPMALLLFDEITQKLNIAPAEVCPMGYSLGSHMAAYVAANRPVGRLLMITPFDSIVNVGQRRYPIFPVRQLSRHPFDTLAEAPKISAPTLFVLAENDTTVPQRHALNLIEHWVSPYKTVEIAGGTHGNLVNLDAYWQALQDFIKAPLAENI